MLGMAAGPLATDVALDGEDARGVVEFLADVFADALQSASASACGVLGSVMVLHARELTAGAVRLRVEHSSAGFLAAAISASTWSSNVVMSASMASSNKAFSWR